MRAARLLALGVGAAVALAGCAVDESSSPARPSPVPGPPGASPTGGTPDEQVRPRAQPAPRVDAGNLCSYAVMGDASSVAPARDAIRQVSACIAGNDPPLSGFDRRGAQLVEDRWHDAFPIPGARKAECLDDREREPGYLAVQTDRRELLMLRRSTCGFLTYAHRGTRVAWAVPVTFDELGLDDDIRRVLAAPRP